MNMINNANTLVIIEIIHKNMYSYFKVDDKQFYLIYQREQVDTFELANSIPHKRANNIQQKRGYESTAHEKGEIIYRRSIKTYQFDLSRIGLSNDGNWCKRRDQHIEEDAQITQDKYNSRWGDAEYKLTSATRGQ